MVMCVSESGRLAFLGILPVRGRGDTLRLREPLRPHYPVPQTKRDCRVLTGSVSKCGDHKMQRSAATVGERLVLALVLVGVQHVIDRDSDFQFVA